MTHQRDPDSPLGLDRRRSAMDRSWGVAPVLVGVAIILLAGWFLFGRTTDTTTLPRSTSVDVNRPTTPPAVTPAPTPDASNTK